MNITEQAQRCAARGIDMTIRTTGICPWAKIAVTLHNSEGGISLLFSELQLDTTRVDLVGMQIDHALQDYF